MTSLFLVEDNPADVQLFRMALDEAGVECNLVVFEDGGEVIEYIRRADPAQPPPKPDMMILDLNLPKNDGLEILEIIRDTPVFADVSIVILSSSSSVRERAKLAAFHVREFIAKPPDLQEYLNIGKILRSLLEQDASQRHGISTDAAG
jgi:CheY-like chemotaxis protein